ncbi:MAG: lysozyme [Bauldia sp.]|nr:lysozyme [Bauldia sp.]
MKTSSEGVAEIAGHEGIVLSPYRDSVGVWTVFVGHTAAAGPPDPAGLPRGVEQPLAAAIETFRRDLAAVEARVAKAVSVPLRQHEFDALVSFDFNTGGIFRARLTKLLNAGDRAGAAAAFDGWRKPPEIAGRREAEKRLFRDGAYSHSGRASLYPADAAGNILWSRGRRVDVLALMAAGPAAPQAGNASSVTPESSRVPGSPPSRQPDDPGPRGGPAPRPGSTAPLRLALPLIALAAVIGGAIALVRRGGAAARRKLAATFRRIF